MEQIENTVFISYRRKDIYLAWGVYQNLIHKGYDVFFDFTSMGSGDFEQIIIGNIKARAHFLILLTPTAFDRCDEPDDWLRREIETAIDMKRNVVPLFFDGFKFELPNVIEKLTGTLKKLKNYNGMNIPPDYFDAAMDRLNNQYLNIPLSAVLHPVSDKVQKIVVKDQIAAIKAKTLWQSAIDEQALTQKTIIGNQETKHREEGLPDWLRGLIADMDVQSAENTLNGKSQPAVQKPITMPKHKDSETIQKTTKVENANLSSDKQVTAIPNKVDTKKEKDGWIRVSEVRASENIPVSYDIVPIYNDQIQQKFHLSNDMEFIRIPAGKFIMGEDEEPSAKSERPKHIVDISYDYWMARFPVTNELYNVYVTLKNIKHPVDVWKQKKNHPVTEIRWNDVKDYCSWLTDLFKNEIPSGMILRLPTEAEWEKSARGVDGRMYPWGNTFDTDCYNISAKGTTPVGLFSPHGDSPLGCADMAGNVWEWTHSLVMDYPYKANDGREDENIAGDHIKRGGSFGDTVNSLRCSSRYIHFINYYQTIGFRVCLAPPLPK